MSERSWHASPAGRSSCESCSSSQLAIAMSSVALSDAFILYIWLLTMPNYRMKRMAGNAFG